jgi:t-SNARE complex subunit (syntaxin)
MDKSDDNYETIIKIIQRINKIKDLIVTHNQTIEYNIKQLNIVYTSDDQTKLTLNVNNTSNEVRQLITEAKKLIIQMKNLNRPDFNLKLKSLSDIIIKVTSEHNKLKDEYRLLLTTTMFRRGKIIMPHLSDDQLQQMAESNPDIFNEQIAIQIASDEASTAYTDALSRSKDITMLVNSIKELNDMMNDLAFIITTNSEIIDRIEVNVDKTNTNVRKGNDALRVSIDYQKKNRKCLCILICIIIVIIIIVLGITISLNQLKII